MTIKSCLVDHTFVVLAYGESPYLCQCLDSILKQNIKSKLIISTSTSSLFLEETANKYNVPLVINNNHRGIADDWSVAYKLAETQYVTLAHQDDIYFPEYTEIFLNVAEKYQDNLIVFSNYYEFSRDKDRYYSLNLLIKRLLLNVHFGMKKHMKSSISKKLLLLLGSPICCPSVMYNTAKIKSFIFNEKFSVNMDWDAWLRLSDLKGGFCFVRKPLVKHRIHDHSETSRGLGDNRRQIEDKIMFKRLWPSPVARFLSWLYSLSYRGNK